jgi:hypothetical protein
LKLITKKVSCKFFSLTFIDYFLYKTVQHSTITAAIYFNKISKITHME